ncbi:MarR family winged helix-turn-helix transcriptional regulator [Lachnospiraceae bacterium OttesenSCG-928-D06]|nr:MarR family winged helix-turn-helix transcriptional regulator [Lachnospiraceae bacterium OttesenSCG-928-D06]
MKKCESNQNKEVEISDMNPMEKYVDDLQESERVTLEIMHLSHQIRKHMDGLAEASKVPFPKKGGGISGTNIYIIGVLYKNRERDIFQKDLEEGMRVSSATISKVLHIMEEKGLIRREKVEYDKRLKKIVLTEETLKSVAAFMTNKNKINNITTKGFTKEEIKQFFYLLKKAQSNFQK